MRKSSLLKPLLAAGTFLIPTAAWAQGAVEPPAAEAPPAEAAPAEPPPAAEAPPAEAPPPAPEPVAEAAAPEAAPAEAAPVEEAPAEEDAGIPSWMRIDSDALKLQFWAGATHDVGGVGIATDIYVDSGYWGEFDIGVEIPAGEGVLLIPMAGIAVDWAQKKFTSLVAPQLFGYFTFDPIYIELWSQVFINSIFADKGFTDDGEGGFVEIKETVGNTWYNRLYLTYAATENFRIGPQVELTVPLNDAAKLQDDDGNDETFSSLQVGGHIDLGYGEGNTLGLYLGYETVKAARNRYPQIGDDGEEDGEIDHGIVGRLTFVRYF